MGATEAKLSIKTKLLLNKVMTARGIALTDGVDVDKRVKCLQKVFDTCNITFKPFFKGEDKAFIQHIVECENKVFYTMKDAILSNSDISGDLDTIIAFLKNVLVSRKLNLEHLKSLWEDMI